MKKIVSYILCAAGFFLLSGSTLWAHTPFPNYLVDRSDNEIMPLTKHERIIFERELNLIQKEIAREYRLDHDPVHERSLSHRASLQTAIETHKAGIQKREEVTSWQAEAVRIQQRVMEEHKLEEELETGSWVALLLDRGGNNLQLDNNKKLHAFCPVSAYSLLRETREQLSSELFETFGAQKFNASRLLIPLLIQYSLASGQFLSEEEQALIAQVAETTSPLYFMFPLAQLATGSSGSLLPGVDSLLAIIPVRTTGTGKLSPHEKKQQQMYHIQSDTSKVNLHDYSFTAEKQDIFRTVLYIWEENPGAAGLVFLHMSIPFLRARTRAFFTRPAVCFHFLPDHDISELFSIHRQPLSSLNPKDAKTVITYQSKRPRSNEYSRILTLAVTGAMDSRCPGNDMVRQAHHDMVGGRHISPLYRVISRLYKGFSPLYKVISPLYKVFLPLYSVISRLYKGISLPGKVISFTGRPVSLPGKVISFMGSPISFTGRHISLSGKEQTYRETYFSVMPVETGIYWQCKRPRSNAHHRILTLAVTRAMVSRCPGNDVVRQAHHDMVGRVRREMSIRNYYIAGSNIQETVHKGVHS